ncbi:MAG TPA: helix-turn-helix transcriptional regulator, partial [Nocardioides sp.]|nr:helix-turn-helix transcriptional regulator [Nocardioides sp.]
DGWLARSAAALDQMTAPTPVPEAGHATALAERGRLVGSHDVAPWTHARQRWEAVGDPGRAAYAGIREAETLLAARSGRSAAETRLRSSWAEAERLDMPHLSRLAGEIAGRARIPVGTPAEATHDDPFHLTRREREVLALVAEGLTDRDIGSRLFISPRTVERHVSNLLAKLDARRRSELTALAIRWHLVDAPR